MPKKGSKIRERQKRLNKNLFEVIKGEKDLDIGQISAACEEILLNSDDERLEELKRAAYRRRYLSGETEQAILRTVIEISAREYMHENSENVEITETMINEHIISEECSQLRTSIQEKIQHEIDEKQQENWRVGVKELDEIKTRYNKQMREEVRKLLDMRYNRWKHLEVNYGEDLVLHFANEIRRTQFDKEHSQAVRDGKFEIRFDKQGVPGPVYYKEDASGKRTYLSGFKDYRMDLTEVTSVAINKLLEIANIGFYGGELGVMFNNKLYKFSRYKKIDAQMVMFLTNNTITHSQAKSIAQSVNDRLESSSLISNSILIGDIMIDENFIIRTRLDKLATRPQFLIDIDDKYYSAVRKAALKGIIDTTLIDQKVIDDHETFFRHIMNGDDESVEVMKQFLGSLLCIGNVKPECGKMLALFGFRGGEGKSTLRNMIVNALGEDNCHESTFDGLSSYDGSQVGKNLLISIDDTSGSYVRGPASTVLKKAISGDVISSREIYQAHKDVYPTCGVLVTSNTLLKTEDKDSDALFIRRTRPVVTRKKLDFTPEQHDRLKSEDGRVYMLLIMLKYAHDLRKAKFKVKDYQSESLPEQMVKMMERLANADDSVRAFIDDVVIKDPDKYSNLSLQTLYSSEMPDQLLTYATTGQMTQQHSLISFTDWCEMNGEPKVSITTFKNRLQSCGLDVAVVPIEKINKLDPRVYDSEGQVIKGRGYSHTRLGVLVKAA